jgi:hypothetical protein
MQRVAKGKDTSLEGQEQPTLCRVRGRQDLIWRTPWTATTDQALFSGRLLHPEMLSVKTHNREKEIQQGPSAWAGKLWCDRVSKWQEPQGLPL